MLIDPFFVNCDQLTKWDQLSLASAMGPASVELLAAGLDGYVNQARRVEELFEKMWPPPNVWSGYVCLLLQSSWGIRGQHTAPHQLQMLLLFPSFFILFLDFAFYWRLGSYLQQQQMFQLKVLNFHQTSLMWIKYLFVIMW